MKEKLKKEISELKTLLGNYTQNIEYGSNVCKGELATTIKNLESQLSTIIISAFPACGKTHMFENDKDLKVLDSDSSQFSWIKDKHGNNTKDRNPDFPQNYINHIKENIGNADVIFVSSHGEVRQALYENRLYYSLAYPDKSLKDEWIQRFKDRGNNEGFINFISGNWDRFIDDIESETFPTLNKLNSGEYISDIFNK